jgi:hypothetical protein
MTYHTKAVYRQGAFFPVLQCDLPEDSQVDLLVQGPSVVPPVVTDPDERSRVLRQVTQRMKQNPIPAGSAMFSRDQLHERR